MLKVKILGISCSPRKGGNTETLVAEALAGARSDGAEVELFSVAGKDINGCDGCQACLKTGQCHIDDDVQEVLKGMLEADGIIFGTPIYFYGMTAQAKAIMDRTYSICLRGAQLSNKVGGIIAVAGGVGLMDAIKDWYFYIAINHMAPASYIGAYASERGAIKEKKREMKMAWELGRQMVQLVDSGWRFPEEFTRRGLGAYVAKKYGL
jgi:multimeric flavodoxin WrbA